MQNLVGRGVERWREAVADPKAKLHLYGKTSARRGRKMGHLTLTGATFDKARDTALQAAALLGLEAF